MSKAAPQPKSPPAPHLCHCGAWGSFGLGLPAQHPTVWWCRIHLPEAECARQRDIVTGAAMYATSQAEIIKGLEKALERLSDGSVMNPFARSIDLSLGQELEDRRIYALNALASTRTPAGSDEARAELEASR